MRTRQYIIPLHRNKNYADIYVTVYADGSVEMGKHERDTNEEFPDKPRGWGSVPMLRHKAADCLQLARELNPGIKIERRFL